ncbi:aminoglycoside phosphotransferase family protein (plasmid) [Hymenobacter tibetensis]|uniref:Aminoglycoside phosphotransferase family protein n=1 Tax=Hymenobacter tibetensis TaxID=497967 RepID=A0ABY4D864_9BACT|nr:aminoglycoside phosphotransferase family protein [Hymenobacter tibetensis]UOG77384.1 aminoglycoside phosphotransferase family protein [Hymenobacter tibetensis]
MNASLPLVQVLTDVLPSFRVQGKVEKVMPFGSGHIHDTFYVETQAATSPNYLLQRVNHHVFKDVPAVMANIHLVTSHLKHILATEPGADPEKEVLTLISTYQDQHFFQDHQGNFWRLYLFLENTRSYDLVRTRQQAYEGGRAYGRFQALLTGLPVDLLHETIPAFHNVQSRLLLFQTALNTDAVGRVRCVAEEIAFVRERATSMSRLLHLGQQQQLPVRITHNDTKFNNVLLDAADRAQCVIDLDTVMPGLVAYDFGDAVRTIVNAAAEDEKDLNKISVNVELFEGFTTGYLQETNKFLTNNELNTLILGVTLLPFLMGLRFLTDYLDGDHYYKIGFQDHNLQRARAQFRLVQKLEEKQQLLQNLIQEIAAACHSRALQK